MPRIELRPRPGRCRRAPAAALATLLIVSAAQPAAAPAAVKGMQEDLFRQMVFAPELVMANQRRIGLTEEQKEEFVRAMQQTQTDLLPLQLEMSEASSRLLELLEGPRVDEAAALEAAERVLELEKEVKRRHLLLVVRIKNLLEEEQQRKLRAIRDGEPL